MTRLQARDPMTRVCSWCRYVIGDDDRRTEIPEPKGELVTHGICAECKERHFKIPAKPRAPRVTCAHCGRPIAEDAQGYCLHCGLAQLPEADLAGAQRVLA